jgi:DNA-binding transcriptional LysR family regulator
MIKGNDWNPTHSLMEYIEMLSYIEALEALSDTGTMVKAATRLRLSQSAISKRIASLEAKLGTRLIEKSGRRVSLTPEAHRLLERMEPLLVEFRSILQAEPASGQGRLTLGVSESILSSWGSKILAAAQDKMPALQLEVHAHRSPVVVDHVASGEYQLGLIAGFAAEASTLLVKEIWREPMVLIPKKLGRLPTRLAGLSVISIEARSGTWSAIEKNCRRLGLLPEREVESFFAVVQMALAGFGHGLAPLGVCDALGLPHDSLKIFKPSELSRPVSFIARPSTVARPLPAQYQALVEAELLAGNG